MGATSNEAKQAWNSERYSQIKISVEKNLASSFRDECRKNGVSIAGTLAAFMRNYCSEKREDAKHGRVSTRGRRRKEILAILKRLDAIKEEEEAYMERIPENLQGGSAYEYAGESVECLGEAIEALQSAY